MRRTVAGLLTGLLVAALSGLAPAPASAAPAAPAAKEPVGGPRLAGGGVIVPAGAPALPRGVSARAWVVADADTGAVLGARDPHGRFLPASTLKTLTALTLLPKLTDRSKVMQASQDDCDIDGTRVGLVPNGKYRVDMLFQCMLMMSGNDCAGALAEANGGIPKTLSEMNAEARRLHADDTHASTPSGLDGTGQATSAYDLALIMRQDLGLADFLTYNTTRTSRVPAQSSKYGSFAFSNDNKLLWNYPGTIAAKNGYTDAARHTFTAAVRQGGKRIIVTLLKGEQTPLPMWQQALQLSAWGAKVTDSVGQLVEPGGDDPTTAPATTAAPTAAPVATGPASPAGQGLPWLPIGIAVVVVVAVAGVFTARRRLVRQA